MKVNHRASDDTNHHLLGLIPCCELLCVGRRGSEFYHTTQRIEVTIPGVNKSEIVKEKTSSTVNYTYNNTQFFQLTLMAYT